MLLIAGDHETVLQLSLQLDQQTWSSGLFFPYPIIWSNSLCLQRDFISLGDTWLNGKLPTYGKNLAVFDFSSIHLEGRGYPWLTSPMG